ncbi:tetratricopeptide repeat protein [Ulvibacterium sp.]|uniref:tetratricopeptide repeat protein n=1 Tax=Ulvibacterium sp. TaxID=2665914 RepID=UPI003BAB6613
MEEKLHKFLTEKLPEKEADAILEELITQEMDADLRKRLAKTLDQEHGITREHGKRKTKVRYLGYILAAAASISILIALVFYPNTSMDNPQLLAQQYLQEQHFSHPGTFKGADSTMERQRSQAIASFNNGDFSNAITHFNTLTSPTAEDSYYLGLSYLMDEQYGPAIGNFEKSMATSERFMEEARWFMGLAQLLEGDTEKAEETLNGIDPNAWKYKEARSLLEKMKNK